MKRGCTGLTERGFAQARALAARFEREGFRADMLLASTLPRARQTADVLSGVLSLDVCADGDLCELIPGEIDGTPWAEWSDRFHMPDEPDRPMSPGGDSLRSFQSRVRGLLSRLADDHTDRTVVAVCHGGIILTSMYLILGMTDGTVGADIDYTSITEWRRQDDRWWLARFNDVAHLQSSDLLVT